jgi:hypothetical protein
MGTVLLIVVIEVGGRWRRSLRCKLHLEGLFKDLE